MAQSKNYASSQFIFSILDIYTAQEIIGYDVKTRNILISQPFC